MSLHLYLQRPLTFNGGFTTVIIQRVFQSNKNKIDKVGYQRKAILSIEISDIAFEIGG